MGKKVDSLEMVAEFRFGYKIITVLLLIILLSKSLFLQSTLGALTLVLRFYFYAHVALGGKK